MRLADAPLSRPAKRRERGKRIPERVPTIDGERGRGRQIPRQEDFVLQMINSSVGDLCKLRRAGLERIADLKVDDAGALLSWQDSRRNEIQEANGECTDERIVQPLGDLMAPRHHIREYIAQECPGFGIRRFAVAAGGPCEAWYRRTQHVSMIPSKLS